MKPLSDEEVIDRASKWARFHSNIKFRSRMDEVLSDLDEAEQRRVYLCGQRIAAGLTTKVIPAAKINERSKDEQVTKAQKPKGKQRRKDAAA
jgi:hypothetical protein